MWSCMYSRETSLDSNPKSTQIFIKYMHDIVLEISFLDINSQNWITGSHLNLLLKSLKIQYICQKFFCMADGHEKTDFWIPKKFLFRPFFDLFSNMMDQKNGRSQKFFSLYIWIMWYFYMYFIFLCFWDLVIREKCALRLDVTEVLRCCLAWLERRRTRRGNHKLSTFYLSWQICHNNFALHSES